MSTYRPTLRTNETYHIFNRSIGKSAIFDSTKYLNKILEISDYYRYSQTMRLSYFNKLFPSDKITYLSRIKKTLPIIEIYSFSFMPNHYHLLIKQLVDSGISMFISNMQNSFAKYFNMVNKRTGGLFDRSFKSRRIKSQDEFNHISRYIHLNPVTSNLIDIDELKTYIYTSFNWYFNSKNNKFVNTKKTLDYFGSIKKYFLFISANANYQRKLKMIKHLLLD